MEVELILNNNTNTELDDSLEVIELEEEKICENNSEAKSDIENPLEKEHIPSLNLNEKILCPQTVSDPIVEDGFNCYICGFETEKQEEFENHQKRMH